MNNKNYGLTEKDIYRLFNHVRFEDGELGDLTADAGAVPTERIKKALTGKIRRQRTVKLLTSGLAAAALVVLCLIGIGTALPSFADNVPLLSSIIQVINDRSGYHGAYAEYSQIVNKSVTSNGLTLTINEVLADDSKLIVGYTVKGVDKINNYGDVWLNSDIKINGKLYSSVGGGAGKFLDDYTYVGYEDAHPQPMVAAQVINVDFNVFEIAGRRGRWNFAFSASKDELSKQSIVFRPNIVLDFPNTLATIDRVVFSPLDTSIFISGKYKAPQKAVMPHSIIDYDYWLVYDDRGVELVPRGVGGGSSDGQNLNCEMDFDRVKDIPKYLTVIPCKFTPSMEGGGPVGGAMTVTRGIEPKKISHIIDGTYPIELAQGKLGRLIIRGIKTADNKTTVEYTAEGMAPYFQGTNLFIKDDRGEDVIPENYNIMKNDQKPNEFTLEFPALDPNRKYSICTTTFDNFEIRNDLKFRIELNQ